jgi:DNA-binding transcriptional ArsR family regulator
MIITTDSLRNEINQLHAEVCSAVADPTRILILYSLSSEPKNVSTLIEELGISQSSVSRHLKVLREKSLVSAMRSGTNMIYSLSDHRLIEALDLLRSILADRTAHRARLFEEENTN